MNDPVKLDERRSLRIAPSPDREAARGERSSQAGRTAVAKDSSLARSGSGAGRALMVDGVG